MQMTLQNLPKIGCFGLKTNHLATLLARHVSAKLISDTQNCSSTFPLSEKNAGKLDLLIFSDKNKEFSFFAKLVRMQIPATFAETIWT
jgi:hypothetical protein